MEIIGSFLVIVGSIFLFLGALGIYRMPDLYSRLQAGTKATTLGAMSVILGVGFWEPDWFLKLLVLVVFIGYSNPLSSHAMARAMFKKKIFPWTKEGGVDAYKEVIEPTGEKQES
ncbi:MAG TPA: monovalent cation/H(+) antiporter subunit G [Saprospiraceae bacterium]|nr:monovalent cation/H(+) antiporter subunit G [Saprospiraceae bacterium]